MTLEDNAFDSMASVIFGSRIIAQVLKFVAQYSLADYLAEGGRSPQSVAAAAGLNDDAVGRLLRYCACIGLTEANADGTYSSTPLLAILKSDDPAALRSFALAQNGPGQWPHPLRILQLRNSKCRSRIRDVRRGVVRRWGRSAASATAENLANRSGGSRGRLSNGTNLVVFVVFV